jgi:hypothetical protein
VSAKRCWPNVFRDCCRRCRKQIAGGNGDLPGLIYREVVGGRVCFASVFQAFAAAALVACTLLIV